MPTRTPRKKAPTLLEGTLGVSCSDCPLPNVIRLCGFDAVPDLNAWVASHRLTQSILGDLLVTRIQEETRALCVWHQGRLFHQEHYWMQTEPGEAGIQRMLGPGCKKCLADTYMRLEETSGRVVPPTVYEVKWGSSITKCLNSILSKAGRMGTANPSNTDMQAWTAACDESEEKDLVLF